MDEVSNCPYSSLLYQALISLEFVLEISGTELAA